MRLFYKIQYFIYYARKRNAKIRLYETLDKYENLERFHYLVNMHPTTYEHKKQEHLRLIKLYESKLSYYTAKLRNLKWKLT